MYVLSKVELYFSTLYEIFLEVYSPGCAHDSTGIHFDMEFVCDKTFLLSIFHAILCIDFSHIKHAQVADWSKIFSFALITASNWPENRDNDRSLIQFSYKSRMNPYWKKLLCLHILILWQSDGVTWSFCESVCCFTSYLAIEFVLGTKKHNIYHLHRIY